MQPSLKEIPTLEPKHKVYVVMLFTGQTGSEELTYDYYNSSLSRPSKN